VILILR